MEAGVYQLLIRHKREIWFNSTFRDNEVVE